MKRICIFANQINFCTGLMRFLNKMRRNKKYIIPLLFLINIIMLVATVIPHHHHSDGTICMKHDLTEHQSCPVHHHQGSDPCCNDICLTHFISHTPLAQSDCAPHFVFIATLFTDAIISKILLPQEQRIKDYYAYKESLHGTNISRAFGLRAPPSSFSV